MTDPDTLAGAFEIARPRLRSVARRLLGSDAEAEDAVQEAWLRLERVDPHTIQNLDAWLTTVVSRISLDVLRSPRRTREQSWEIEPWAAEDTAADPAEAMHSADLATTGLLIVLDLLTPAERLAFVLHDVFGVPFAEIGAVLGFSSQAVRQQASRARRRVRDVPRPARPSRARERSIVEAWLAAARDGDLTRLLALLDEDAVLHADYGASATLLQGSRTIAEQAALSSRLAANSVLVRLGGRPGVLARLGNRPVSVMAFEIRDDRIVRLDVLADPDRLSAVLDGSPTEAE